MITAIPGLPPGALGFRVAGSITVDEYRDVVESAVSEALARGGTVDAVAVLDDIDGFEPGVMLRDAALGLRDRHEWGRLAVVSDNSGVNFAIGLFSAYSHLDIRVFGLSDEAAAIAWVSRIS